MGLPDLASKHRHQLRRVLAANKIYKLVAKIAKDRTTRLIPWTLENPVNSIFWLITFVIDLLDDGVADILFDRCMHGGNRNT